MTEHEPLRSIRARAKAHRDGAARTGFDLTQTDTEWLLREVDRLTAKSRPAMDPTIRSMTTPAARLREYADELNDTGEAGSLEVAQDIRAVLSELFSEHLALLKAQIAALESAK